MPFFLSQELFLPLRNRNCTANVNLWHPDSRQEQIGLSLFSRHLVRAAWSISILQLPGGRWRWNLFGRSEIFFAWVKAQECWAFPRQASAWLLVWQCSWPGSALSSPFSESHICSFHFVGFSSVPIIKIYCSSLPLFRGTMALSQLLTDPF